MFCFFDNFDLRWPTVTSFCFGRPWCLGPHWALWRFSSSARFRDQQCECDFTWRFGKLFWEEMLENGCWMCFCIQEWEAETGSFNLNFGFQSNDIRCHAEREGILFRLRTFSCPFLPCGSQPYLKQITLKRTSLREFVLERIATSDPLWFCFSRKQPCQ